MATTLKDKVYRDFAIVAFGALAGQVLDGGPGATIGGASGSFVVIALHALPPILETLPKPKNKAGNLAFSYDVDTTSPRWLKRPLREFFGARIIEQPAPARPLVLKQNVYGSFTYDLQPFIMTDDDLYRLFNAINRIADVDRNLSYRELVGRRRVRRLLYEAFMNLLRFTQWYTGYQLIERPRHQWYSLVQPASTVRALFAYVEHTQRGRGAGAPSMRQYPGRLQ